MSSTPLREQVARHVTVPAGIKAYGVDQQGATFVFTDKQSAEQALVDEAWRGAVALTIFEFTVPRAGMTLDELAGYAVTIAPDVTTEEG